MSGPNKGLSHANLAYKETERKITDTIESEAVIDGVTYSNKQITDRNEK